MTVPNDPRQLPPPQQIALLTLRGGELAQACISALRADGASSPNEMDYIALSRARLCMRYSGNRRSLTPIGKHRADELARAIATASAIHVVSYAQGNGSWIVRCSCGEFSTSRATAIRDAFTKVMASAGSIWRMWTGGRPRRIAPMSDAILDAIDSLDGLTSAAIRDADDAMLGQLFHLTHNWHLIAAAERMRRREAATAPPDRSAPTQPQERP